MRFRALLAASLVAAALTSAPQAAERVLTLQYSADLAAIGFPNPILRATVNGQSIAFLIDTGASVHTVAKWFVTAAHLRSTAAGSTLRGSTGAIAQARDAAPFQVTTRDGNALDVRGAAVVDFPQIFADQHIAGLLSPQMLAPAGQAAVLNLRAPSLTFAPIGTAVASLGVPAAGAIAGTHICPTQGNTPGRLYAVPVTVAGIDADMTVDTGATETTVASTRIARALAARASNNGRVQGIGGDTQTAQTVDGVTVVRAGTARKITLTLGGTTDGCGPDGLLGMDALRGCTLVLGDKTFAWTCGGS